MNSIEATGGPAAGAGAAPQAPGSPAPALPCLLSEQLNQRGGRTQKKTRKRLELEVAGMAHVFGFQSLGFFTGTFPDNVKTIKEAQRRFNSLNTNAMKGRFRAWVSVVQRHKDGRIHLHLVVVCKEDIRTGFDFVGIRRRDYSSASPYLKAEWKFWRDNAPKYGFGRVELLPIRTTVERFAGYVSRYLIRQDSTRLAERGARLVRYSKGWKTVYGAFSWAAEKGLLERIQLQQEETFHRLEIRGIADAEFRWGRGWRRHFNRLFYSRKQIFEKILSAVERSLEFYNGVDFALAEAWVVFDKRSNFADEQEKYWKRYNGTEALYVRRH
jgi:hypothetical protein